MLKPDAVLVIAEPLVVGILALVGFRWVLNPSRNRHARDKVNEIFA
jgi:hypothetical protein